MTHIYWYLAGRERPNSKCPFCAGDVPWTVLSSSKVPRCPTCNAPLRVRFSLLLLLPLAACGYWLTYAIAGRMGLTGFGLFIMTFLLGYLAGIFLIVSVGAIWGRFFPLPLEPDPGSVVDDGRILHLDAPPRDREHPE